MAAGPALAQLSLDLLSEYVQIKSKQETVDLKAPRKFVMTTKIAKTDSGVFTIVPSGRIVSVPLLTKQELLEKGYTFDEIAKKRLVRLVDGVEYY